MLWRNAPPKKRIAPRTFFLAQLFLRHSDATSKDARKTNDSDTTRTKKRTWTPHIFSHISRRFLTNSNRMIDCAF